MARARQIEASSSYASTSTIGSSTYDVFLNFRANDTRKGFTGHLYSALMRKGINVCMDSDKLWEGENIGPKLLEAIQGSKIFITIFSKAYADSRWCLMELEKILESRYSNHHQIVLPIFLDVDPSDVRNQKGSFQNAFSKHFERFQPKIVECWRRALTIVGDLWGWIRSNIENGDESRLVELVVERCFNIVSATTTKSFSYTSTTSTTGCSAAYDVYINFRGIDTRKGFTSHLHNALKREQINVFIDSKLPEGEEIGSNLLRAIEGCKISIVVLSEHYAHSSWCLNELVHIMECRISNDQIVLPIFFDVEPCDVRHQSGSFGEAFQKFERIYDPQRVKRWREALTEVGNLKGWVLNQIEDGDESRLIEHVVQTVLRQTSSSRLSDVKHPIGLDDRVNEFASLLDIGSKDVRFVGICGKGGIGKTSIAKAFCSRMVGSFDHTCFLANIREETSIPKGLVSLQEKLIYSISNRKVAGEILNVDYGKEIIKKRCRGENILLVLDDVDDRSQLEALAIGQNWFGQGSRIIITTRDKHILNVANVGKDKIFWPQELNDDQSLQLFTCHAFQKQEPIEEYIELSREVARYSQGLPLALEVLGSYLSDIRNKEVWEDTLQTLKEILHKEVHEKLKISYENLDNDYQKIIFLDAACFFVGWEKETLISIWEACGYHPKSAIEKLIQRSLLKFNKYERLEMHDLVRDMGRKIVFEENPMEPSKRSRLWSLNDIFEVLEGPNKVTENINGILPFDWQNQLSIECLAKMPNLRFLDLSHSKGDDVPHLPYRLRWFRWIGCPIKVLPDDFYHKGLVHLDLSWSQIQLAWNNRPLNEYKKFQNLKVLRLSQCRYLSKCPDFSWFPCLEQLDLNWCNLLGDLDDSIGRLSNLRRLILSNCESLNKLPQSIGGLKSLVELQLRKTGIDELPDGVGLLEKLKVLSVEDCEMLVKLPRSVERMRSLDSFNLNGTSISKLPNDFLMLSSLVELYMSGNVQEHFNICSLPIHFGGFSQLQKLKLSACRSLESLPADLSDLKNLQELFIGGWEKLQCLPELPSSLTSLECLSCKSLAQLPDLSCLKSLRILSLEDCYNLEKIRGLGGIESLELFWVERCYKVTDTPRKQYFQVRPLDDGLERYDTLFPSPRCLGALRRLTNNQRPRDYSFSNANDGSCKRLSLIIVFSFRSNLNDYLIQEGELVDIELEISTDIFWKDGKSTQCNHTILIENVEFTMERDIVYIHDLDGFTWFGFPLEGKNAMTELYVHGRGLYKLSDSGIYRRLRHSFSCVELKFWSLEYVNEESGQSLPKQEWIDRIVKDILNGPWPHVDSGARSHTVFDSHSALIEQENFGSMQHILHRCGRTCSSQFHDQFVRTEYFGLEEPEEDKRSAEKDRFDSHSVLEEPEEDKRSTAEIDSHPLVEEREVRLCICCLM